MVPRTETPLDGEPVLAVDGVSIRLGGRTILRDVGFRVQPGEFTGLIGPNGSGKTTLLRILLGLIQPDSGTVTVTGQGRTARGTHVGYVPQKVLLDPDIPLRARDVVELGLGGRRFGIGLPSPHRRKLVDEMLEAVDATHFADSRIGLLSGGEQQRVLVAHALISRPKLLLLDEPLANLDLASANDIVRLLSRIAREQHVAVLLSAHEMNPLLPVTDRIVYIAHGRAASGSVDEVITTDTLTRLYGHPVDVVKVRGRVLVVADTGPTCAHTAPTEAAITDFTETVPVEPKPDNTDPAHADPTEAQPTGAEPAATDSTGHGSGAADPAEVGADLAYAEPRVHASVSTSHGENRGEVEANLGRAESGTSASTGVDHGGAETEGASANGFVVTDSAEAGSTSSRGV